MYRVDNFEKIETDNVMEVFVANLSQYNEGKTIGEWIALPITEDEFEEVKERIGNNQDVVITACRTPIKELNNRFLDNRNIYYEESDLDTLNEYAEELNNVPECDYCIINAFADCFFEFETALNLYTKQEYYIYRDCYSMADVAREIVESGTFRYEVPDELITLLDYKSIGHDLELEGTYIQIDYKTIIQVYY